MADKPKRVYWDTCAWIGFINCEPDKITPLRTVWDKAVRGHHQIWTSSFVYLEVIKGKAGYGDPYPPEESDIRIEETLSQSFVQRVPLDTPIGQLARKLKREKHAEGLSKRSDAIHLATALHHNCDEMHTWDRKDLLQFSGLLRRDGAPLPILIPTPDPDLFAQSFEPKEPKEDERE